ncbi:CDP-glycerol glycerophosphotransferase family protein [Thioalkalivibrio paradoxus]|uniref:CDP-glycerol:glycerophosphate glycerophosphotransferase n=1 Tax=Thioalkalivibrio paradoxus ARh 1 TaxID=713585 RepID=W0DIX8_9GAMM|nr:CDP-glycerol glycerophosphotransferase family protein [Thioalkalivibrio paradoxus]AHE96958.1 CDP-glycerol:glycerophosphate glycerophosphotransferase [Thioalkalivibrio paradoxus ARh 1]
MKIDKTNPVHWLLLALFGLNVVAALVWRPFRRRNRPGPRTVVLYGHKLSGNLLAIYRHLRTGHRDEFRPVFLTMDPAYHRDLTMAGEDACLAAMPSCAKLLASAEAIISDHGLHALQPMLGRSDLKFFDVWHGIPFKGFDADDFRVQHRYDETWVASPLLSSLYTDRFGFDPARVKVTGYGRTDALVVPQESHQAIRNRLGLQHVAGRKLVLFAPTWKQDASNRSLFPFGIDGREFMEALAEVCQRNNASVLFRAHLNAKDPVPLPADGVFPLPFADYPDTEAILQLSDVLICDWSSIAFDFLLLDRPTLFLDVEPPFRKGFSLGPEYRFGPVVSDLPDLLRQLERSLADPEGYRSEYGARHEAIREQVYGSFADGRSAERCVQRLNRAFVTDGSSR